MQLEEAKEVLVHYFRTAIGDDKFTSESKTEIENAIDSIVDTATHYGAMNAKKSAKQRFNELRESFGKFETDGSMYAKLRKLTMEFIDEIDAGK